MKATGKNHGPESDVAAVAAAGGFHFHNPHCPLYCRIKLQTMIFTCGPIKYPRFCCSVLCHLLARLPTQLSLQLPTASCPCGELTLLSHPAITWWRRVGRGELAVNWQWQAGGNGYTKLSKTQKLHLSLEVAHEQGHWAAVPHSGRACPEVTMSLFLLTFWKTVETVLFLWTLIEECD